MTQFPNTSTSLPFDPRSNAAEAIPSRRDNQSAAGSSEDSRFSQALDNSSGRSDARSEERRADTQAPAREQSPTREQASQEIPSSGRSADQSADTELINEETGVETQVTVGADEQNTTEISESDPLDVPTSFDLLSFLQQPTSETPQTSTPLLASTAIAGITTQQQNIAGTLLDPTTAPQVGQLGQEGQIPATQINGALPQANNVAGNANNVAGNANNVAGNVVGDAFETVLTTQLSNAGAQTTAQNQTNLQQNVAASGLQTDPANDLAQQPINPTTGTNTPSNTGLNTSSIANPSAGLNTTSTEGEQLGSLANSNQSTATPSQQLASLLSGGTNADVALPNQGQLANTQLQQAVPQPVQQAAQPLAQFANASFANDTLPAFTAQISRNFAAGQDSFNVRLNPSELGRVDVRVINNDDGTVSTQIRVERSETLDLFQRDIRALERTLQQSGVKLGSDGIDLSLKDNGADQGGNNQAFDNDFDGQGEHAQNSDPALEADDTNQHLDNDGLLVDDLTADIAIDQVQTIYARYQPGQLNIRV